MLNFPPLSFKYLSTYLKPLLLPISNTYFSKLLFSIRTIHPFHMGIYTKQKQNHVGAIYTKTGTNIHHNNKSPMKMFPRERV